MLCFDWSKVEIPTVFPHMHVLADHGLSNSTSASDAAVILPASKFPDRMCLVLDLDETLVHVTDEVLLNAEGDFIAAHGNLSAGEDRVVNIYLRPYVRSFLIAVSEIFEVVTFTAGDRSYAETVLGFIDPEGTLIHHRLYREHCSVRSTPYGDAMLKDLRVLGRDLTQLVFVDNSISAFALQPDNGLVVNSFRGDSDDVDLVHLVEVLCFLQDQRQRLGVGSFDVRTILRDVYQLSKVVEEFDAVGRDEGLMFLLEAENRENNVNLYNMPESLYTFSLPEPTRPPSFIRDVSDMLVSKFPAIEPIFNFFRPLQFSHDLRPHLKLRDSFASFSYFHN